LGTRFSAARGAQRHYKRHPSLQRRSVYLAHNRGFVVFCSWHEPQLHGDVFAVPAEIQVMPKNYVTSGKSKTAAQSVRSMRRRGSYGGTRFSGSRITRHRQWQARKPARLRYPTHDQRLPMGKLDLRLLARRHRYRRLSGPMTAPKLPLPFLTPGSYWCQQVLSQKFGVNRGVDPGARRNSRTIRSPAYPDDTSSSGEPVRIFPLIRLGNWP